MPSRTRGERRQQGFMKFVNIDENDSADSHTEYIKYFSQYFFIMIDSRYVCFH